MTKSIQLLLAAFILVGALFSSCNNDDESTDNLCIDDGNFGYAKVGNKLTFDLVELFSDADQFEVEVTEEVNPGFFNFKINTTSPSFPSEGFWVPCGNTIFALNDINDNLEDNTHRFFDSPVGTTWTITQNGQTATHEILEKNVEVTTPAGTFQCDKISFFVQGTINVDTIFESSQFGTVKYDGILFDYELREKNF